LVVCSLPLGNSLSDLFQVSRITFQITPDPDQRIAAAHLPRECILSSMCDEVGGERYLPIGLHSTPRLAVLDRRFRMARMQLAELLLSGRLRR
jgi:hypothetical protein